MAIVDMLTPEVIKVPLVSRNKDEVLKELVEILAKAGKISNLERDVEKYLDLRNKLLLNIPNILDENVPIGKTEEDNVPIKYWGTAKLCDEYKGRAGAYSLQECASLFIHRIEGSPTNVLGIPMAQVREALKKWDIDLFSYLL